MNILGGQNISKIDFDAGWEFDEYFAEGWDLDPIGDDFMIEKCQFNICAPSRKSIATWPAKVLFALLNEVPLELIEVSCPRSLCNENPIETFEYYQMIRFNSVIGFIPVKL